jgi:DNA-binding NarL/FixJ family response regulator
MNSPDSRMTRSIHLIAAHPVARESYTFLIDRQHDLEVTGQARSVPDGLQQMQVLLPDAVVISLPAHAEALTTAVRTVRNAHPDIPIVAVVPSTRDVSPSALSDAGATACITREQVPFDLLSLVRHVLGITLSPANTLTSPPPLQMTSRFSPEL